MPADTPTSKRVLLKISGEALMGNKGHGVDPATLDFVIEQVGQVVLHGFEVAIVVGGGNIFRGLSAQASLFPRHTADTMGMLATIMNALAISAHLENKGYAAEMMSGLPIGERVLPFNARTAQHKLSKGVILVFGGGTSNPYFTTDTAAVLRALEINAGLLIKATKVDGVFSADPATHPDATMFTSVTYEEVLQKNLRVMDQTAVALARDNMLPMLVMNLMEPGGLLRALKGEQVGTRVIPQ